MHESNDTTATIPVRSRDVLSVMLRDGAQRLLAQAIEAEVVEWIDWHAEVVDDAGRRQVVRNGHHPSRTILTGVGPVEVTQPRVHDRWIVGRRKVEVAPGQTVTEAPIWRLLNAAKLLPDVIAGVRFINGEKPEKTVA